MVSKLKPERMFISNVRCRYTLDEEKFMSVCQKVVLLNGTANIKYERLSNIPYTLGADRFVSLVAVNYLFPNKKCLIIDFGTAITVDYLDENGKLLGGTISIGLRTRLNAINHYIPHLPLVEDPFENCESGVSTEQALRDGMILGIMFEVEGYIRNNPDYTVVFTGGDANYFAKKVKSPIFVINNLVLLGLAHLSHFYGE
jgi:type III pantothenate kinase